MRTCTGWLTTTTLLACGGSTQNSTPTDASADTASEMFAKFDSAPRGDDTDASEGGAASAEGDGGDCVPTLPDGSAPFTAIQPIQPASAV